jgi:hypothetical protein
MCLGPSFLVCLPRSELKKVLFLLPTFGAFETLTERKGNSEHGGGLGIVSLASCEMSNPTSALRSLTSLLHHMRVPGRPVGPPSPAMSWGMLVGVIPLVKITITTSRTYLNAPVHSLRTRRSLPQILEPLTWATLQREGHNGPHLGTCHLERDTLTAISSTGPMYGSRVWPVRPQRRTTYSQYLKKVLVVRAPLLTRQSAQEQ